MISVVINTLNEEKNIGRAIESVKSFADEIVVVDMESVDNTVSVAKKLGAVVFTHKPMHYVEPARNFAISKAKGEWIFIIDADEEAPKTLLVELGRIAHAGTHDFVRIPRKNIIFGKWMQHSRWWPDENIRFFKKGSVSWEDEIHSIPVTKGEGITLKSDVSFALTHHHYDSVEQFIDRLNRYTSIQAEELHKRGKSATYVDFVKRPTSEFVSRYFAGLGYKDGIHGIALAFLQAFSELCVYLKLWQLGGFRDEHARLPQIVETITESQKEVNYWKAHAQVTEGAGVTARVKRRFKLQ